MTQLHVRLLGDFRLALGQEPVSGVDTPRLQSLLAYLVLHREAPQSRQHLAFLLWPDSSEGQARTNLRNLFFRLRNALPDGERYFLADASTLQWHADAPYTLDVADFEDAVARARQAERAGNRDVERGELERAAALYEGELLRSCYDDWITPERERLSQLFVSATTRLIDLLEALRDYAAAIDQAQRLLRHDELQEDTYRQLMRLHSLSGNNALALRVYHSCVTVLQRELGTEPSPALRAAYERIVSRGAQPAEEARPLSPASAAVPLVGRHGEWQRLQTAWRAAAEGHPGMVLVAGEAGVGKTRLAEELLQWAARQGITTAAARSYAAEGALAYAPVAALLRSPALRPALAGLADVWWREVARIVPEIAAARPKLPPPDPLTESWQRTRLFEALARAVLGARQPLLLLLDDLQWCDQETLEWLRHLLHGESQARLMVIGTYRPEEVDDGHPLRSLQFALQRGGQLVQIELGPLGSAETFALAQSVAGCPLPEDMLGRLYRESEGNALFVVEAVRGCAIADGQVALSPQVKMVIQERLARLSPSARDLAALAAAIGREFSYPILAAVSDDDEDAIVCGLDELWHRRILREHGADGYDFAHDRIRAAAYALLSTARRRLVHRRIATALEATHRETLDAVSGQIASHYERAGLAGNAARYYRRAGDAAMRIYALSEATAHYTRGLELARTVQIDAAELALLYASLGRTYELDSRFDAALATYIEMERVARELGDRSMELSAVVGRITLQATPTPLHDPEAAREPAERALALARQLGDQAAEARILWLLLHVYGFTNQMAQAIASGEQSLVLAQELGWREQMAYALNDLGFRGYLMLADTGRAREVLTQASAIWRELGNRAMLADSLSALCSVHTHTGDYDLAIGCSEEAYEIARSIGNKWGQSYALYSIGAVHWERGHPDRAIAEMQECVALGEEAGFLGGPGATRGLLAWVYAGLGACDLAIETARRGLAIAEQERNSRLSLLAHLARVYVGCGRLDEAGAAIARGREDPLRQARPGAESLLRLASVELALQRGNAAEALATAEELLANSQPLWASRLLDALCLRAAALRALGRDAPALQCLRQARAEAERVGSRRALWRILHALGQLEPDRALARALGQQAREIVGYMADHAPGPELRRSFLNQPEVRAVLSAAR